MTDDLRSKFIVDEESVKKSTTQLIEKALKYGRVSKNGDVIIDQSNLSQDNKLKLALILRFLAHSLDETISESVRPTELTRIMGERIESVGSRLSKLAKENFVKKSGYGQYVVQHYRIQKFFDDLENGGSDSKEEKSGKKKVIHKSSGGQKNKPLAKIGEDIQALINTDFFKTPKFVIEVKKKLEEEVKYYDIRTIDTAIRKTFVASRKILKRIPNTEKGKAKWKYVVR